MKRKLHFYGRHFFLFLDGILYEYYVEIETGTLIENDIKFKNPQLNFVTNLVLWILGECCCCVSQEHKLISIEIVIAYRLSFTIPFIMKQLIAPIALFPFFSLSLANEAVWRGKCSIIYLRKININNTTAEYQQFYPNPSTHLVNKNKNENKSMLF